MRTRALAHRAVHLRVREVQAESACSEGPQHTLVYLDVLPYLSLSRTPFPATTHLNTLPPSEVCNEPIFVRRARVSRATAVMPADRPCRCRIVRNSTRLI